MRRQVTSDGHSDVVWRARLDELERATPDVLLQQLAPGVERPRVLVLSAHPDDETLGGGRLIADWVMAGVDVHAVVATAGEACFDVVGHVEPGIAQTRLGEWRRALKVLGVRASGCLRLPDGGLPACEGQVVEGLRGLVEAVRPNIIAGTHRDDPHPDHGAVGRAVETVAEQRSLASVCWPVWLTYFANPPGPEGLQVVDCSTEAEQVRQAAWHCFTSQREPIADDITAVVPPAMTALLRNQLLEPRPAGATFRRGRARLGRG